MFTTNNLQGTPTIQYQTQELNKNVKTEITNPTFSYNLNKIQMLMPQQGQHSTVNLAQLSDENKQTIQYITQPYFGNYALVNTPMQMMTNGITMVNKPLTAVSYSSLSLLHMT